MRSRPNSFSSPIPMLVIIVLLNSNGLVQSGEKLALLSTTLRTYQKAACDTDQVIIACPRGTSISIEFAQYNKFIAKDGITIEELCPIDNTSKIRSKSKHLLRGSTFGSQNQKVPANRYVNGVYSLVKTNSNSSAIFNSIPIVSNAPAAPSNATDTTNSNDGDLTENCMWPNALQYSLLQTVVEACQKKKHCKFNGMPHYYGHGASGVGDSSGSSSYHSTTASSKEPDTDPCPKRRQIVEVAYKCRPYEFRSKVACHNDVAQLECNPYSRIAVYSASFGRTAYESIQCPQPQGVREETCLASYATETVMQICHGRRRCNIAADANTFGSPCQPNSRMYLKVVYTCVPKQVLQDKYGNEIETDETDDFEGDMNDLYDEEVIYKESEAIPKLLSNTTSTMSRNSVSSQGDISNATINGTIGTDGESTDINPVMTHSYDLTLEDDQERLYFYLLIAGLVGVLLCGAIVAVRIVKQKRHNSTTDTHSMSSIKGASAVNNATTTETTIPNGFNDTISEIDTDIDLTSHIPLPSVSKNENYVTYESTSNMYGTLGRSNMSQNSPLLVSGNIACNGSPSLIANPLIRGSRQSPDLIGLSSNALMATNNMDGTQSQLGGLFTPAILIGSNPTAVVSSSGVAPGRSAISTVVPLTSLAQYTTAPTIRSGYLINTDAILSQSSNIISPSASNITNSNNDAFNTTSFQQTPVLQQQQISQFGAPISHQLLTSTLRRTKPSTNQPLLQHQLSYDGTSPRTNPTGVPVNSQFYYG